jgi:uncharacterized coiled-coil protein SlyX
MDPQIEAMFQAQEQQISALTQRVAELEQHLEQVRDMASHMADHVGFSHPGWGS